MERKQQQCLQRHSCEALQSASALWKMLYWRNKYLFALAEFTFYTLIAKFAFHTLFAGIHSSFAGNTEREKLLF